MLTENSGFFGRGEMQKEFEDAAFELRPGEMSHAVETASGIHLIERYALSFLFSFLSILLAAFSIPNLDGSKLIRWHVAGWNEPLALGTYPFRDIILVVNEKRNTAFFHPPLLRSGILLVYRHLLISSPFASHLFLC